MLAMQKPDMLHFRGFRGFRHLARHNGRDLTQCRRSVKHGDIDACAAGSGFSMAARAGMMSLMMSFRAIARSEVEEIWR